MANATVSLSSTSFTLPVEAGDSLVTVASIANMVLGLIELILFVDQEAMLVEFVGPVGTQLRVKRGAAGTAAARHATNSTVYFGRPDQFYAFDPRGVPPATVEVYPWINLITGTIWVPQGDESGPGNAARIWAAVTITNPATGPLGSRVLTTTTPS